MKVLITGAAGFIGGHLAEHLRRGGHSVVGVDNFFRPSNRPENRLVINADVRSREVMDHLVAGVDLVYHLAAEINVDDSIENPREVFSTNVDGTLEVLEACRKHGKKLVYASSSEVYGSAQGLIIDESHPLDAQSPYAASKTAGDRLCWSYGQTYGMDISILRNFNTFGPYQREDSYGGVIAIFVSRALRGEKLGIFGDGKQERDYMWITDALAGYDIAASRTLVSPLNVASGTTVTIGELARLVIQYIPQCPGIEFLPPRPGEVRRLCGGISYARSLGFNPGTDFEKHLYQYIRWRKKWG